MNGIINVYKEKGYTSFDVVAKLRKILNIKKIGHTGTLDPDAEGVLPVCIGNAVRLSELLSLRGKSYEAVIKLGIVTDTQDITGKILEEKPLFTNKEVFLDTVMSFLGEYNQLPPMFSAIKVNGQKLYKLAREGREVERASRMVNIHSIDISDIKEESGYVCEAVLKISCSKGTYIRTLCHDIGIKAVLDNNLYNISTKMPMASDIFVEMCTTNYQAIPKLSQGACMKSLIRTRSGDFLIHDSIKLKDIENIMQKGNINEILIPVEKLLSYRSIFVNEESNKYLVNGNKLYQNQITIDGVNAEIPKESELFKVYDNEHAFTAIYKYDDSEMLYRPYKMFL